MRVEGPSAWTRRELLLGRHPLFHESPIILSFTLPLKIAQKPLIVCSLGPKAVKHESLEPSASSPHTTSGKLWTLLTCLFAGPEP